MPNPTVDAAEICNLLQNSLDEVAGSNYPAMQRESVGLLEALLSERNEADGELVITDQGDGKPKKGQFEYLQPGLVSEIGTAAESVCTDGQEVTPDWAEKTITRYRRTPTMKLTKTQARGLCDRPVEYRAKLVGRMMNALLKSINQDLVSLFDANVGLFYNGVAAGKNIAMIDAANFRKAADPQGEMEILEDMANLGLGSPFLVGAGKLSEYARLANIGCCNDYGQDLSQLSSAYDFYRDMDVDAILTGTDNILAFAPGAARFLSYNENKADFSDSRPESAETTIVDPVTGIEFDMEFYYDRCAKKWQMQLFLNYDLWQLPNATDTLFQATDPRDQVNYSFRYTAINTPTA